MKFRRCAYAGLILLSPALGGRAQTNNTTSASPLKAAVARVDITPPLGLQMYGYMDRTAGATGVLDPLYARVLVLEAARERLALVTLDLGRTFSSAGMAQLNREANQTGVTHLLVTASHTHAGPNIQDQYTAGDSAMAAWEETAVHNIATAISAALPRLIPVRLGVGRGSVFIGYNRRVVKPDGTVEMLWSNPQKQPTIPIDSTLTILRVDDLNGSALAVLVNYACHPVIFGADNLEYSADWPGVMAAVVERGWANARFASTAGTQPSRAPLCFFLQGGDGDINPYFATTPRNQDAVSKRDWTGQQIGSEVLRAAARIQTRANPASEIQFAEDPMSFAVRWAPAKFRDTMYAKFGLHVFKDHAEALRDRPVDRLTMSVTTVLIDKRIALVGLPGEPFVDFQINTRDRSPVRDVFFLGYSNGYFDYFPTVRAASQGGYGAADSDTYVEPGAGEAMVNHCLITLYRMLGRLSDTPEE